MLLYRKALYLSSITGVIVLVGLYYTILAVSPQRGWRRTDQTAQDASSPQTAEVIDCGGLGNMTKDDCLDMMVRKTVFVNAMSSDHFMESHNFIGSVQQKMPGVKIIVYDIGLNAEQVSKISKMCNVELRHFDFSVYPEFMRPLKHYAWKPLAVKEVSLEHPDDIVVWSDTSIRFKTSLKEHIFPYFLETNMSYFGIPHGTYRVNIAQFTHNQTISYFNLTRDMLTDFPQIQSGLAVFWMKDNAARRIVNEWAECANHEECIAPHGTTVGNGQQCTKNTKGPKATEFVGCHRFDQSALDMIIFKVFGKGLFIIFRPLASKTCDIARGDNIPKYNLTQC